MRFLGLALVQLLLLAVVVGAFLAIRENPQGLMFPVAAVLVLFPTVWLLISAISPTSARKCPKCGAEALAPAVEATAGLDRCSACGFEERK